MSPDLRAQSLTRVTGPDTRRGTEWRDSAACATTDSELWHAPNEDMRETTTDKRARIRHAKAVCATCPVIQACLTWAIESRDRYAILGGTLPEERNAFSRRSTFAATTPRITRAQAKVHDTRTRVIELNKKGLNGQQIADATGMHVNAIYRHLRKARELGLLEDRSHRLAPATPDPRCGTPAGYAAHHRRRQTACDACRVAEVAQRAKREAR